MIRSLRYLVPSAFTAMALTCGVVAAVYGAKGQPIEGSWWVLTATILDRLDGFSARALKASSRFGAWFDSVSDFVAFGVAPSFLMLGTSSTGFEPILLIPMLVYTLGCGIRLTRFSLDSGDHKGFDGVPSTLAGGVYAAGLHVALAHGLSGDTYLWMFAGVLILFGIAMNVRWLHYGKVGAVSIRWLNRFGVTTLIVCTILILLRRLPEFVFAASALIMITAPLISSIERRKSS